jgi:hypothetical protein
MVSRYTAMCDFRKKAPIAVAPGYVLEGVFAAIAPQFSARALLEPPGGLVGRRSVVFTPEPGVVI